LAPRNHPSAHQLTSQGYLLNPCSTASFNFILG
jgi:hypothetical protein